MLIGIDWGGTKIEGIALLPDGTELARERRDTPRHDWSMSGEQRFTGNARGL